METLKLYQIAEERGIKVENFSLPKTGSVCVSINGSFLIALDEKLNTRAEERVRLAHEIGHCENLAFYNINASADVRGKHESKANRWAINALVPEEKYYEALKMGYTDIHSLAEHFEVTEDFMKKAAEHYENKKIHRR